MRLTATKLFLAANIFCASYLIAPPAVQADPSKYPEFAQQNLPPDIVPAFVNVDELIEVVKAGAKPLIIDVRTLAEFNEAHILGSVSAPLAEFKEFIKTIPRDRPIVLY
ncbi:MAG: rhodanese-like domain-containing protein [Deltaproteobacteria bacterium]|nr:rhodanese-like domain-containing protein [Deltaproteobacteria bacterium]